MATPPLMLERYLPFKWYSVHKESQAKWAFVFLFPWLSLRASNQQYKEEKRGGSRPRLMTHTRWLCGVVWQRGRGALRDFSSSSCGEFVLAGPLRMSVWILSLPVFFFVCVCVCSSLQKNLFFFFATPEWESINGIWRVGSGVGGIEEVLQSIVSWVGGSRSGFFFVYPPSLLGIRGQGGIQLLTITSPQPRLLISQGFSCSPSFSPSYSFFPPVCVRVSISRASCCL